MAADKELFLVAQLDPAEDDPDRDALYDLGVVATGMQLLKLPDGTVRVLVEGVNRIKKHTRISQNQRGAESGGIVTQEAAIHVSNVMVCDSDGKPTRIGKKAVEGEDGTTRRVRISRRNGKEI